MDFESREWDSGGGNSEIPARLHAEREANRRAAFNQDI